MNRKIIFRFSNFVSCLSFWATIPMISQILLESAGGPWTIRYLFMTGLFSFISGFITFAIHFRSSRWLIVLATICNFLLFVLCLTHCGLAAKKLSIFNQQQKNVEVHDEKKNFQFSLILNAIIVVSIFNGNT